MGGISKLRCGVSLMVRDVCDLETDVTEGLELIAWIFIIYMHVP